MSALGKVRSSQSAELNWETSGTVEQVLVSIGQQVQTGEVLARLEQTSLPESVIMAQADLTTGTSSTNVQVRTRDVAITKFTVPQTAKVNTTKEIAVEVTNRRYSDNVQVQLFKGLPGGGEQLIGTLTIYVPSRANRATLFKFSYTFTGCDAAIGKVTFRTVATPVSGRDALPADNSAIRTALVTGSGTCSYP